jgi:amino acid transporter
VTQVFGNWAGDVIAVCACVSLVNSAAAILMYYSRVLYVTARDGLWPEVLGRPLRARSATGVPLGALAVLLTITIVMMFMSALNFLLVFLGTVVAVTFFLVGIAALIGRRSQPDRTTTAFRMPAWPLPPVLAVAVTAAAVAVQQARFLISEVVVIAVAVALWVAKESRDRR